MELNSIAALFVSAHKPGDLPALTQNFLGCYAELEDARDFSLRDVVAEAFEGLGRGSAVSLYRRAALEIASRIDAGEDGSALHAYHNAVHFAKVVANFRALATLHNAMIESGQIKKQPKLSAADIAKGLLAAVAHDIFHNGSGNTVDGVHVPFRLEQKSIDAALGWVKTGNSDDDKKLKEALSSIYATDVSGSASPARMVREAYNYHFKSGLLALSNPYPQLAPLLDDAKSTLLGALLQDSDTLFSVLDPAQYEKESELVAQEAGREFSAASGLFFLDKILDRHMTTSAARALADKFILNQMTRHQNQLAAG